MQHYKFKTTVDKGMIFIPENILSKLSSEINVIIQTESEENFPADITVASEKALSVDWLLPEEDLVWQNL